jgi:hypothetical protein
MWGGREQIVTVHDPVVLNPNDKIENASLKAEAALLEQVATLGKKGLVSFLINIETQMEVWGLPNLDSESGQFYGVPLERVEAPVRYGRIMFGASCDYKQDQFDFLRLLRDDRFDNLQRITGAYQGSARVNRNQLLDAFNLWCAEHHRCQYFLSLDFKLARVIGRSKSKPVVPVVRPSELLSALNCSAS